MIIPVFALHRTDKFDSAGSVRCAGNYSSAYEAGSIKLQQSVMALFRQCLRLLYAFIPVGLTNKKGRHLALRGLRPAGVC